MQPDETGDSAGSASGFIDNPQQLIAMRFNPDQCSTSGEVTSSRYTFTASNIFHPFVAALQILSQVLQSRPCLLVASDIDPVFFPFLRSMMFASLVSHSFALFPTCLTGIPFRPNSNRFASTRAIFPAHGHKPQTLFVVSQIAQHSGIRFNGRITADIRRSEEIR
jgi:hypothetical protein